MYMDVEVLYDRWIDFTIDDSMLAKISQYKKKSPNKNLPRNKQKSPNPIKRKSLSMKTH